MKKIWDNKKDDETWSRYIINQLNILLILFPFSDQKGRKVRLVIVSSNNEFNKYSKDFLIVGVTSNISKNKYTLPLSNNDLDEGKLFTQCFMKVENMLKIDKELVIKKLEK